MADASDLAVRRNDEQTVAIHRRPVVPVDPNLKAWPVMPETGGYEAGSPAFHRNSPFSALR